MWDYWHRVLLRANRETLLFLGFGNPRRFTFSVIILALVVLIIQFTGGSQQLNDEIGWLVTLLRVMAVFYLPTFLWNLLYAPSNMERDDKQMASDRHRVLLSEVRMLQRERDQQQAGQSNVRSEASLSVSRCFVVTRRSRSLGDEISGDATVFVATVELVNTPARPSAKARIGNLHATITFVDQAGRDILSTGGYWPDDPVSFIGQLRNAVDFGVGEKHLLELAFKLGESGQTYASDPATVLSYSEDDLSHFRLSSSPLIVRAKLTALGFEHTYEFTLEGSNREGPLLLALAGNGSSG